MLAQPGNVNPSEDEYSHDPILRNICRLLDSGGLKQAERLFELEKKRLRARATRLCSPSRRMSATYNFNRIVKAVAEGQAVLADFQLEKPRLPRAGKTGLPFPPACMALSFGTSLPHTQALLHLYPGFPEAEFDVSKLGSSPSLDGSSAYAVCFSVGKCGKPTVFDFLRWRICGNRKPFVAYRAARVLALFLKSSSGGVDWLLKHLQVRRIIDVQGGCLLLREV